MARSGDLRHGVSGGDSSVGRSATKTAASFCGCRDPGSWRHWVRFKLFILLGSVSRDAVGLGKARRRVSPSVDGSSSSGNAASVIRQRSHAMVSAQPCRGVIGRAAGRPLKASTTRPLSRVLGSVGRLRPSTAFLPTRRQQCRARAWRMRVPDEQQRAGTLLVKFLAAPGAAGAKGRSVRCSQPPFP